MNPMRFIRTEVFGADSQEKFAALVGVRQATVSRWETGVHQPGFRELSRIRRAAETRGIAWDDAWFFDDRPLSQPERQSV